MELVDEGVNFIGGSRGGAWGPGPPLFFDQNEARRAGKNFFGDQVPPYLRVWMTPPPLPLSEGLDLPLNLLQWFQF